MLSVPVVLIVQRNMRPPGVDSTSSGLSLHSRLEICFCVLLDETNSQKNGKRPEGMGHKIS